MKRFISHLLALTLSVSVPAGVCAQTSKTIDILPGETWWGAATDLGTRSPLNLHRVAADLRTQNFNNQAAPLLVSNKGRGVWADGPFSLKAEKNRLTVKVHRGSFSLTGKGKNLRDAYLAEMQKHFPATGKCPPALFFDKPVYNSWIELTYDQNQNDILRYAHAIIDNGFPAGVLMIDDNWQKDYGDWEFRPDRFPDPKAMVDTLHAMGFKVMLWVCPFVSPDSKLGRDLEKEGYFVKAKDSEDAAVVRWWNGHSFAYDLSNPKAFAYLKRTFKNLQAKYAIDGFKFDAGDPERYLKENVDIYDGKSYDVEQTKLWATMALDFPYNEMRACWELGNQPLIQRLGDKKYSWEGVSQLVPDMIAAGLLGYAYTCPDMIGGGEYGSFYGIAPGKFNQALMIRSCQIHSMMPVMQFSVAPWRMLSKENLAICRRFAKWHEELGGYIRQQAELSARTGEPIVRHMDYSYPDEGFENVNDQYMLGDRYLVAPVSSASTQRTVKLPQGKWRDDQGKLYKGGRSYQINVPLDRLPWFEPVSK